MAAQFNIMQTITDNASVGVPTERVVLIVYFMFKPCVCPCFAKKLLCVSALFRYGCGGWEYVGVSHRLSTDGDYIVYVGGLVQRWLEVGDVHFGLAEALRGKFHAIHSVFIGERIERSHQLVGLDLLA